MDVLLAFCTFPNADSARQIGTQLVESQLAACVNLCHSLESVFRWEGKVESTTETLAIFKTTAAAYAAFSARLAELHPYDVPEIVAVRPEHVAESYAAWVTGSVVSA